MKTFTKPKYAFTNCACKIYNHCYNFFFISQYVYTILSPNSYTFIKLPSYTINTHTQKAHDVFWSTFVTRATKSKVCCGLNQTGPHIKPKLYTLYNNPKKNKQPKNVIDVPSKHEQPNQKSYGLFQTSRDNNQTHTQPYNNT